ncbi:MAG: DSD1 family PLP-dependent enzyme [Bacillota bacterium]|nr:DSD1 family PLP-dependent enzyme [Bacillota bacterium]
MNATGIPKHKSEIETPALVIDLDAMERNMALMNKLLSDSPTIMRPHAKSHKTPQVGLAQIAAGAVGVTCAKAGEAEAMVDGGVKDVLIASELVGGSKNLRAARLARRADVKVACESAQNVSELSAAALEAGATVGAVIEADIGNRRCGVRTPEQAAELAKAIVRAPGLAFRGIMGYEGQCVFIQEVEKRRVEAEKALGTLMAMVEAIRAAGIPVEIVSAGGTGTFMITGHYPGITDIQAGSYVLMDSRYASIEGIPFEQSLTLLSTVMSRPLSDLAVLDYGLKSITREFGVPGPASAVRKDGTANPYGLDGVEVLGVSEEHTRFGLHSPSRDLRVGDKVDIVPSHCCTTMNTHDIVYVVRGEEVQDVWRITGRGKSV